MFWEFSGCRKARRDVQLRMDGDLEDSKPLSRHIELCPPCREYADESERMRALLPAWKAPRPAPDFAERTLDGFLSSRESAPQPELFHIPRRNPFALPFALAAGVLFLVGFTFLFSPSGRLRTTGADAVASGSERSIGRAEMIDSHRDVDLLGIALPTRSAAVWNFR